VVSSPPSDRITTRLLILQSPFTTSIEETQRCYSFVLFQTPYETIVLYCFTIIWGDRILKKTSLHFKRLVRGRVQGAVEKCFVVKLKKGLYSSINWILLFCYFKPYYIMSIILLSNPTEKLFEQFCGLCYFVNVIYLQ
jgi:hypothetical protein